MLQSKAYYSLLFQSQNVLQNLMYCIVRFQNVLNSGLPERPKNNFFELKHHFELLHISRNENYKGEAFTLISERAKDVLVASKTS